MMETLQDPGICFPQLNTSCEKRTDSKVIPFYTLLPSFFLKQRLKLAYVKLITIMSLRLINMINT